MNVHSSVRQRAASDAPPGSPRSVVTGCAVLRQTFRERRRLGDCERGHSLHAQVVRSKAQRLLDGHVRLRAALALAALASAAASAAASAVYRVRMQARNLTGKQ